MRSITSITELFIVKNYAIAAIFITSYEYLNICDKDLAQLLLVFETMALAIERKQLLQPKKIPYIDGMSQICKEINNLQEALNI